MSKIIVIIIGIGTLLAIISGCAGLFRGKPAEYERKLKLQANADKINNEFAQLPKYEGLILDTGTVQEHGNTTINIEINAEMIYEHVPEYPATARYLGQTGKLWVRALVDDSGTVRYADVSKSSGNNLFDRSAVIAAYKCKYNPALLNGRPVALWVTYLVEFSLF